MHLLLYRLLVIFMSPILFGHIAWLAIKNKNKRYFWQRLGFHSSTNNNKQLLARAWFHCASVGEVNTLLPVLKKLNQKNNKLNFIITTNTITGAKIVKQQNLSYLEHHYLPFDWIFSIKCFLFATHPSNLYVMETEIWPNLFTICHNNNIPVRIINARLSNKTMSANTWIKSLLKTSLSRASAIYARSANDAQSYKELGNNENDIQVTGNLKFASIAQSPSTKLNFNLNEREYVLLASTHDDEEKNIYAIWQELQRDELLIIAPRHPERCSSIIKKINCENIAVRSKADPITNVTQVFILDTVGELSSLFADAKAVIMGGSFIPVGGHNILEAASHNKAIITGPFMANFSEELALMKDNQAIIHIDSNKAPYIELKKQLHKLLNDNDFRFEIENNTNKLTHNAEQVLDRYTSIILNQLE